MKYKALFGFVSFRSVLTNIWAFSIFEHQNRSVFFFLVSAFSLKIWSRRTAASQKDILLQQRKWWVIKFESRKNATNPTAYRVISRRTKLARSCPSFGVLLWRSLKKNLCKYRLQSKLTADGSRKSWRNDGKCQLIVKEMYWTCTFVWGK